MSSCRSSLEDLRLSQYACVLLSFLVGQLMLGPLRNFAVLPENVMRVLAMLAVRVSFGVAMWAVVYLLDHVALCIVEGPVMLLALLRQSVHNGKGFVSRVQPGMYLAGAVVGNDDGSISIIAVCGVFSTSRRAWAVARLASLRSFLHLAGGNRNLI